MFGVPGKLLIYIAVGGFKPTNYVANPPGDGGTLTHFIRTPSQIQTQINSPARDLLVNKVGDVHGHLNNRDFN